MVFIRRLQRHAGMERCKQTSRFKLYILPKLDVSVVSSSVLRCAGRPDVCHPFDLCGYVVVLISLQWVFRRLLFRGRSGVSAPTFILVKGC